MDEPDAIHRLKRGDIDGLEVLVRRYQLQAVRAASLIVRDPSLAQDVVQTAFVRAYERIGSFDARRPFGPWFLKLVVNDAIRAAARRSREVGTPTGTDAIDPDPSPERAWERPKPPGKSPPRWISSFQPSARRSSSATSSGSANRKSPMR